ncbi:MAG: hypothetical protein Hals2KO_39380 [Halioglobus sp.]
MRQTCCGSCWSRQSKPGQQALWLNGAEEIFPDYTAGQGGVSFLLPANSEEIILTRKGL